MDPNVPSTSAAGSESDSVNPTRPYHDDDDRREREWLEEARRELFGMLSAGAHEDVTAAAQIPEVSATPPPSPLPAQIEHPQELAADAGPPILSALEVEMAPAEFPLEDGAALECDTSAASTSTMSADVPSTSSGLAARKRKLPASVFDEVPAKSHFIPSKPQKYDNEWCRLRRERSNNQVKMIEERELGRGRRGRWHLRRDNDLYATIPLDRFVMIEENKRARDTFVGWTPDGRRIVAFCMTMKAVIIYEYLGVERAKSAVSEDVVSKALRRVAEITLPNGRERGGDPQQQRDFVTPTLKFDVCMFTRDSKHMIVVATGPASDSQFVLSHLYSNPEALPLQHQLENYCIYCIDVQKGVLCDTLFMFCDKVSLSSGMSLCGRHLMILSIQQQIIHIFTINESTGHLIPERELGPSVHLDDPLHVRTQFPRVDSHVMTGFKQRLNAFLYRRARERGGNAVTEFLRGMGYRTALRIHRAQLMQKYYVLLRMAPQSTVRVDFSTQPCFFVIMDWRSAEILEVFTEYNRQFIDFFEDLIGSLMYASEYHIPWMNPSLHYPTAFRNYIELKRGENRMEFLNTEQFRRFMNFLPFYSNLLPMESPYLDTRTFSWDDKFHANVNTGRIRTDGQGNLTKIISRRSSRLLFTLPLAAHCRQLTLLFHPTDPLVFGVDRTRLDSPLSIYLPLAHEQVQEPQIVEIRYSGGTYRQIWPPPPPRNPSSSPPTSSSGGRPGGTASSTGSARTRAFPFPSASAFHRRSRSPYVSRPEAPTPSIALGYHSWLEEAATSSSARERPALLRLRLSPTSRARWLAQQEQSTSSLGADSGGQIGVTSSSPITESDRPDTSSTLPSTSSSSAFAVGGRWQPRNNREQISSPTLPQPPPAQRGQAYRSLIDFFDSPTLRTPSELEAWLRADPASSSSQASAEATTTVVNSPPVASQQDFNQARLSDAHFRPVSSTSSETVVEPRSVESTAARLVTPTVTRSRTPTTTEQGVVRNFPSTVFEGDPFPATFAAFEAARRISPSIAAAARSAFRRIVVRPLTPTASSLTTREASAVQRANRNASSSPTVAEIRSRSTVNVSAASGAVPALLSSIRSLRSLRDRTAATSTRSGSTTVEGSAASPSSSQDTSATVSGAGANVLAARSSASAHASADLPASVASVSVSSAIRGGVQPLHDNRSPSPSI